ncbi:hypothetical protein [Mucilaginibacter dorajii]|uniref:DUF4136 domain-containing protein n=1 Tax=Mucilaginibacter dorajii TaxID=692994 RepID=A0ABP7PKG0_9SPHI|nr:hypothetical protein [Mucilaginibacter dorajii]MCS3733592.1 hypothetical protein [Mucilaginibacter dorajii]
MKVYLIIILGAFAFSLNSCKRYEDEKFSKTKWTTKNDMDYPMREPILNDLIKNHKLKGLTYKQLIDSLGESANYGDVKDSIYYNITVNYGYLDPKSGKYLVLSLNKDSIINGFKVVQWHNRHVNE